MASLLSRYRGNASPHVLVIGFVECGHPIPTRYRLSTRRSQACSREPSTTYPPMTIPRHGHNGEQPILRRADSPGQRLLIDDQTRTWRQHPGCGPYQEPADTLRTSLPIHRAPCHLESHVQRCRHQIRLADTRAQLMHLGQRSLIVFFCCRHPSISEQTLEHVGTAQMLS